MTLSRSALGVSSYVVYNLDKAFVKFSTVLRFQCNNTTTKVLMQSVHYSVLPKASEERVLNKCVSIGIQVKCSVSVQYGVCTKNKAGRASKA